MKTGKIVIPGNPGEGRGRPGIQDFRKILDSGFRRNDAVSDFRKSLFGKRKGIHKVEEILRE